MSYLVNDVMAEYTDRSTGNKQVRAFIVADTAADLPANSTVLTWLLGSYALTVDTGYTYYIDSSGSWILQPNQNAFSNVYTKTEIDDLLDQIDQLDDQQTAAIVDLINDGVKNRFPVTKRIGPSNASAAATYTQAGVLFTCNADGSITIERISANVNQAGVWLYDDTDPILVNDFTDGTFVFSNGFAGSAETARLRLSNLYEGSYLYVDRWAVIPEDDTATNKNVSIVVYPSFTGTVTVKPMVCRKSYWDMTQDWIPYTPTLQQMYQMINTP